MLAVAGMLLNASGLLSKILSAALFVLLARTLSVKEFGLVVAPVSVALGVGAFAVTALADAWLYAPHREAEKWTRPVLSILFVLNGLAVVLWPANAVVCIIAFLLGAFAFVEHRRRSSQGGREAVLIFLLGAPVSRLAFVGSGTLNSLDAVALGTLLVGALQLVRTPRSSGLVRHTGGPTASGTVVLMAAIGFVWLWLGQIDIVALGAQSPDAAGAYLPTMKLFEALTAVGAVAAMRLPVSYLTSREPMVTSRAVGARLMVVYLCLSISVVLIGPWLVPVLFGPSYEMDSAVALPLVFGYAALCGSGPLLQAFVFRGDWMRCMAPCALMMAVSALIIAAAHRGSVVGVATFLASSYIAGYVSLLILSRSEHRETG